VLFILFKMRNEENPPSELKTRLFCGALVGAFLGMVVGTLPTMEPLAGLLSMGVCAVVISMLSALSNSFWESLRAAWELVRIAFWRW